MKITLTSVLLTLLVLSSIADAQTPLRQSTSRVVRVCGAVAVGDGFTPVTTLALGSADEAEVLRDNTATLDISGATFAAITGADGCYSLTLDTTATNTVGELLVVIQDDSLILPMKRTFQVVEESVYDNLYAGSAVGPLTAAASNAEMDTALADYDGVVPDDLPANFADLSITSTTGRVDVAAVAGTTQTANDNGADINTLVTNVGTPPNLGGGATLADNNADIAGAGFVSADDSNEAIRNRGDAAWVTRSGGTGMTAIADGTAQGGAVGNIQLASAETFGNDILNGNQVCITGGTGAGQCRYIEDYVGSTDTATVSVNFGTAPSSDSTYEVWPASANVVAWNQDTASVEAGLESSADYVAAWRAQACGSETADTYANRLCDDIAALEARITATRAGYIDNLNGHTPQTGDSFGRLGAPAGASHAADLLVIDNFVDELESRLTAARAGFLDNLNGHTPQTGDSFGRIGVNGAGLSNIDLPDQTMDITGNLSGSVGSVTGHTPQTGDSFGRIGANGSGLGDIPWNGTDWDAEAQSEALDAINSVFNFTVAGQVDSNIQYWNDTQITTALQNADDIVNAIMAENCDSPAAGSIEEQLCTDVDALVARLTAARAAYLDNLNGHTAQTGDTFAAMEMQRTLDTALLNCEVNTANFAGSSTTLACILTDRDDVSVTQATGDLEGLELVVMSGAEIREQRFIIDTTWDGANSELRLTLGRALPATLADAVTAIIR